jgi:hypothetical protein
MALELSTRRRSSNRPSRILRALTAVAIALAGTLNAIHLSGAANMQAAAQVDAATLAVARDLCRDRSPSSLTASGLRLHWVGGTLERLQDVLRLLRDRPQLAVATSRNWVAVYDFPTFTATRLRCSDGTARSDRVVAYTAQLAISESGDLAAAGPLGDGIVLGFGAGPSVPYNLANLLPGGAVDNQPRGLVWVDRRLYLIGDIRSQVVTIGAEGVVTQAAYATNNEDAAANQRYSVVPLGGFIRAFSYNGQIFAERSDSCFDLFADRTLTPRIRDVACLDPPFNRYVAFDGDSARVLQPDGTLVWQGPRVLGLAGRVDGNREAVGQAVQRVQSIPWLTQDPLPFGGRSRGRVQASRAQFDAAYKATIDLAQTNYKGVDAVPFPTDRGWVVNSTVALRWQTGPESVTPTGAPLSAIASTRYHLGKYTDDDLTNILRSNASLERTLEGRLFLTGFVPIGALFGGGKNAPVIVASQNWLERAPLKRTTLTLVPSDATQVFRQIGRCDLANPAPFPALTRFLANGVPVVGDLGGDLLPLPPTSDLRLRAEKVGIVTCFRESSRPLKLVVLENVAASGERLLSVSANQPRITAYGITFQRVVDDEWPLQLVGPVVAGIMVDETDAGTRGRLDALRMWLDEIYAQRRVSRLLVNVSYLDLFFAADTTWSGKTPAIPNVKFLSGERVAASARAACIPPDDAPTRQQRYEKLIRLKPFSPENRSVEGTFVGVVENAVRLMDERFVENGTTIWRTLKDGDRLVELNEPPANMSQNPDALLHGTRVAAVIYSKLQPSGLVASPRLMWLDAGRPDSNALTRLSGERPVVNVSQKLEALGWESLLKQSNALGILFVAAAHNPNQGPDGLPLDLKLPNVIGVGVVDENGNTPESLLKTYDRFQVDLLAPGFLVPVVGEPAPECLDGTSYASPYVTAVASMLASRAQASPAQIKARMLATATWQDRLGPFVRGGIINATRALDDVFRRVLTFQDPQDPEKAGLVVTVDLDDNDFLASGFESGRTRDNRTGLPDKQLRLNWKEILRLTRTGQRLDSQNRMRPVFRMVFVHEKKYQVWDDVSILQSDSAMPISTCLRYDDRMPVQCRNASVDTVFDYVGRLFTRTPIDAF